MRPAQAVSCSMAAARNVSAAARRTLRPARLEAPRELRDRRRLARAVDPDDEDDRRHRRPRLPRPRDRGPRREERQELVLERDIGRHVAVRARPVEHLDRELRAHVRADEGLLDLLPRVDVGRHASAQQAPHAGPERAAGRLERIEQRARAPGGLVGHAPMPPLIRRPRSACRPGRRRPRAPAGPPGAAR